MARLLPTGQSVRFQVVKVLWVGVCVGRGGLHSVDIKGVWSNDQHCAGGGIIVANGRWARIDNGGVTQ